MCLVHVHVHVHVHVCLVYVLMHVGARPMQILNRCILRTDPNVATCGAPKEKLAKSGEGDDGGGDEIPPPVDDGGQGAAGATEGRR